MSKRDSHFRQDSYIRYPIYHIIHALITGAPNHTNKQNTRIENHNIILRIQKGKNLIKYQRKTIKIVILKPLTANKWVSHDLLKSVLKSLGMFSLAQSNIQPRNIFSSHGYIFPIFASNFFL